MARLELAGLSKSYGEVRAVAFSFDGTTLLTGSSDSRALLWEGDPLAVAHELVGHNGAIMAAAFDPGGQLVASRRGGGL